MKKIIFTTCLAILFSFVWEAKADEITFTGYVDRLAIETGESFDGVRYLEVTFTDTTTISGSTTRTYYAIPVSDAAFPYMFAILKYAKTRNKSVKVSSSTTWTRYYSDGSESLVFNRITYVE